MHSPLPHTPVRYLRLPQGRQLAYRVAGEGMPVLYCHGFPSTSHEIDALPTLRARFPVQWIGVDRPGYGASDHDPGRTAESLADDYAALLDHLRLPKARLLCVSGGTPGALAFIRRHPQRIEKLAVLCGMGFMGRGEQRHQMSPLIRAGLHMAKQARWVPDAVFNRWSRHLVFPFARAISQLGMHLGLPADRLVFEGDPVFREVLEQCFIDAFSHGGPGMARDLKAWIADDGAWLGDLRLPVAWWHGTADRVVPFVVGQVMTGAIPGAQLRSFGGDGHFSLIPKALPEAMGWILE